MKPFFCVFFFLNKLHKISLDTNIKESREAVTYREILELKFVRQDIFKTTDHEPKKTTESSRHFCLQQYDTLRVTNQKPSV